MTNILMYYKINLCSSEITVYVVYINDNDASILSQCDGFVPDFR